jgi:hypothetical protein
MTRQLASSDTSTNVTDRSCSPEPARPSSRLANSEAFTRAIEEEVDRRVKEAMLAVEEKLEVLEVEKAELIKAGQEKLKEELQVYNPYPILAS